MLRFQLLRHNGSGLAEKFIVDIAIIALLGESGEVLIDKFLAVFEVLARGGKLACRWWKRGILWW